MKNWNNNVSDTLIVQTHSSVQGRRKKKQQWMINICDATTIDVVGVDAVVVAAECNSWEKTSR